MNMMRMKIHVKIIMLLMFDFLTIKSSNADFCCQFIYIFPFVHRCHYLFPNLLNLLQIDI